MEFLRLVITDIRKMLVAQHLLILHQELQFLKLSHGMSLLLTTLTTRFCRAPSKRFGLVTDQVARQVAWRVSGSQDFFFVFFFLHYFLSFFPHASSGPLIIEGHYSLFEFTNLQDLVHDL